MLILHFVLEEESYKVHCLCLVHLMKRQKRNKGIVWKLFLKTVRLMIYALKCYFWSEKSLTWPLRSMLPPNCFMKVEPLVFAPYLLLMTWYSRPHLDNIVKPSIFTHMIIDGTVRRWKPKYFHLILCHLGNSKSVLLSIAKQNPNTQLKT